MAAEEIDQIEDDDNESDDPKESLIQLLKTCRYTLKAYDREHNKTRKHYENPIMTALVNYLKLVENKECTFDDFKDDYTKLFKKYRDRILADDDKWMCDENDSVVIHIGDSKSKRSKKKCALHLSAIYQKAANLFDKYYSPNPKPGEKIHPYLFLPTRFIHHLNILFLEVANKSSDIERLGELIEKSSGELGITDGTYTPIDELGSIFGGGSMKDNITSLMKIMFSTAKRNGIDVPDGEFDVSKLMGLVERIMSGGFKNGAIGDLVKNIGKCKDTQEVIGAFKQLMTQPELLEEVSTITGMKINQEDITKVIENSEFETKVTNLVSEGSNLFNSAKETLAIKTEPANHNPSIEE